MRASGWSAERPGYAFAIAFVGAVLAALGGLVFDWTVGAGLSDIRQLARQDETPLSVVTQLYVRVLFVPLLTATILVGLLVAVGRTVARVAIGLVGVLAGFGLVAAVVWVELGNLGTDSTRQDALPLLVLIALVGVASVVLGGGAMLDEAALQARALAASLAGLALVLHLYAISDVGDAAFGAWCTIAGFALLVIAAVVPYRRIIHTAR